MSGTRDNGRAGAHPERSEYNVAPGGAWSARHLRLARAIEVGALLPLVAAGAWVILAATAPLGTPGLEPPVRAGRVDPVPVPRPDLQPLLNKMACTSLMKPALAVAAVKDDGSASKLLKRLKLHGVTRVSGQLVAYVEVEKVGVQTVHEGDSVLDFIVEKIESGCVTLSLNGVIAELRHV
jgi:hypothetical protein